MQYVIENTLPDGPHWYAGQRKHQHGSALISGALWSPYWEDARKYPDTYIAQEVKDKYCSADPNSFIIDEKHAQKQDSRRQGVGNVLFIMRLKYVSVGMTVIHAGSIMAVKAIDHESIVLEKYGVKRSVGIQSMEWVEVLKPTPDAASEPLLCAMCGTNAVNNKGDICTACDPDMYHSPENL